MKSVSRYLFVSMIIFLIIGCSVQKQVKPKETLGDIKDLIIFMPDENATWIYKGTGVYYHEMTLEDIITSDQSIYYKIKGEILSGKKNSTYRDHLTEIRYIISRKGWQQELMQSKLLDSKYKGMYLLKFPIEENNTWEEKVLDFDDRQRIITGKIETIDYVNDEKVITVKYSEKNSDYYEVRKIMQGKGVIAFEQNIEVNQEYHQLGYSLENIYYSNELIVYELKGFLEDYNNAWENYYNNDSTEILDYVEKNSSLASSLLSFEESANTQIDFLDLSIEFIQEDGNQYIIEADETFIIQKNGEEAIQSNTRKYTLIREGKSFRILKIE